MDYFDKFEPRSIVNFIRHTRFIGVMPSEAIKIFHADNFFVNGEAVNQLDYANSLAMVLKYAYPEIGLNIFRKFCSETLYPFRGGEEVEKQLNDIVKSELM